MTFFALISPFYPGVVHNFFRTLGGGAEPFFPQTFWSFLPIYKLYFTVLHHFVMFLVVSAVLMLKTRGRDKMNCLPHPKNWGGGLAPLPLPTS